MQITDLRPGITKNVTLSNAYQKLSDLMGISSDGVFFTVITYNAEIAFADTQPSVNGHPLAVGDILNWSSKYMVNTAWVRNGTASSNSVLIVTPLYAN